LHPWRALSPESLGYAAKEHRELETRGTFKFTYACNSMKQAEVLANPRLEHPVVVNIPMAKLVGAAKK
jgi:hypothetical protein